MTGVTVVVEVSPTILTRANPPAAISDANTQSPPRERIASKDEVYLGECLTILERTCPPFVRGSV
jgi:hypothetical protein